MTQDAANDLFELTMQKKWDKVVEIYEKHPESHKTTLTESDETALHISVLSYCCTLHSHSKQIKRMIDCIEKCGSLYDVLSMQDTKGDTPLHLAAAVGWEDICEYIASKDRNLISLRNLLGETPLFIAVHHGLLQTFLCLHQIYNQEGEADESLCRKNDGTTILHYAISGDYLILAYQVMSYYPKLINSVNDEGESPLHILARKRFWFESSSELGFFASIIYRRTFVDQLKKEEYIQRATRCGHSPGSEFKLPEKYRTCANIFFLFWNAVFKSISAVFRWCRKQNGDPIDEEDQHDREKRTQDKESSDDDTVPPNYTSSFLSKFSKVILISVLGVKVILISVLGGYYFMRIKGLKHVHSYAFQIMSEMIELKSKYKYETNARRPVANQKQEGRIHSPDIAPHPDKHDVLHTTDLIRRTSSSKENKSGTSSSSTFSKKETPLLVAAKSGVVEMVKKIIDTTPAEAILDQDSNGKNVLMLAVEYRQISVFDYLVTTRLPAYLYYQFDNDENNILHVAATLGEHMRAWRTPCVPLQMSWEIKWFQHVGSSIPHFHDYKQRKSPRKLFIETHENLVREGKKWLTKTSESCSVIAVLIASVTFATIVNIPGGLNDETGHPILENYTAFDIFSIASLFALCLSITALIFFLAIITSRCEPAEFGTNLPIKLLMALTSMSASIVAMLVAFCAGHTFILSERLKAAAVPIYLVATLPVMFFAIAQLPLYIDFVCAAFIREPLSRYRPMYG